jgi:hypothetical protein
VASQLLVFAACRNLRFDILYQRRPTLLEIQKRCLGVHQRFFSAGCFGVLPSSLATVNMTRLHPSNLGCQASRNRQALVFGCLGHTDGNFSVLACLPDLQSTSVASQLLVFAACRNLRFDILYQRRPTLLEIQKRCLGVHQRLFYTGCFGVLPSSLATVNMTRQHPSNLGCQASRNRQALVFGCLGHNDGNFSVLASSILICSPFLWLLNSWSLPLAAISALRSCTSDAPLYWNSEALFGSSLAFYFLLVALDFFRVLWRPCT